MKKKLKTCRKAIAPRRQCGKKSIAELRAKGRWNGLCRKHADEFRSLFGEQPEHFRFL